jgi:beta-lactamase regulating signal transducer with metallopeptidase domain
MNDFLQALMTMTNEGGRFLLVWSWQVCLLLASVYLLLKLCRFRAATIRYQVWSIGLFGVVLLPFCGMIAQHYFAAKPQNRPVNIIVDVPANILALQEQSLVESSKPISKPVSFPFHQRDFLSLLFLLWAAGFLFAAKQLSDSYWQSLQVRMNARTVSLAELECADLEDRFRTVSFIEIKLTESVTSPILTGLLHPTILLPADLTEWTTVEERKTILLHEMIHAQRKDQWANYFQSLVRIFFFFHPLVRYASNQLSMERELSCDEKVLFLGVKASSYVESILKVAEKGITSDVLHQPAFITKKMLERRIEMILKNEHLKWSAKRWTLLILPVALIAIMLWVLIPGRSASAQRSQEVTSDVQERHQVEERLKMEREKEAREKERLLGKSENPQSEEARQLRREMEIKQALQGAEVLAQVAELQVIYGKRHDTGEKLIDVSAAETVKTGEQIKSSNVVVKTPEFTMKAEHATEHKGIVNIIGNPIEIESNGQVYYSYNAIALAQRGTMLMYVVSKHASLFKEKNPQGEQVEFAKVLRDSN